MLFCCFVESTNGADDNDNLSIGEIIGIILAVIVLVIIIGIAGRVYYRNRKAITETETSTPKRKAPVAYQNAQMQNQYRQTNFQQPQYRQQRDPYRQQQQQQQQQYRRQQQRRPEYM